MLESAHDHERSLALGVVPRLADRVDLAAFMEYADTQSRRALPRSAVQHFD
jgi:hypothetical protein